jgi:hypothetical protein
MSWTSKAVPHWAAKVSTGDVIALKVEVRPKLEQVPGGGNRKSGLADASGSTWAKLAKPASAE